MDDGTMIGALRNVVRPPDLDRLMNDAADEIERLRAEVEALRTMLAQAEHDIFHDHQTEAQADYQAHMAFLRSAQ